MASDEDLLGERAWLVRRCARLTGTSVDAEDLAQDVLLRAHAHRARLRDPTRRRAWLAGIARHACADWRRVRVGDATAVPPEPWALDAELDRAEIHQLLDRALARLSPETRSILIARYVDELSPAEIANRHGIGTGALAMRLQRGRQALRHLLETDLAEDAAAFGLAPSSGQPPYGQTRMWCDACGMRRLWGRYVPGVGLHLYCPGCTRGRAVSTYVGWGESVFGRPAGEVFGSVRGYRAAANRVAAALHAQLGGGLGGVEARCRGCGRSAPVVVDRSGPGYRDTVIACRRCGGRYGLAGTVGVAGATPAARAFLRRWPRVRTAPARVVEAAGTACVVVGLESLTGGDRLELLYTRDSLVLLRVASPPPGGRLPNASVVAVNRPGAEAMPAKPRG